MTLVRACAPLLAAGVICLADDSAGKKPQDRPERAPAHPELTESPPASGTSSSVQYDARSMGTNIVVWTAQSENIRPSIWTGDNVRLDFGHTPLQRAPHIFQPTLPTNHPSVATTRVERARDSRK